MVYMNSVSSAYFFKFFASVPIKKISSTNFPDAEKGVNIV